MIFIIKGYCYFHNFSADMSSGLLQVFVELWETSRNFELRPLLNTKIHTELSSRTHSVKVVGVGSLSF